MAMPNLSGKHLAINKANTQMVAIVAVAAFVTVFCLVAAKAVWSQTGYQSRVIAADNTAHQQLIKNAQAFSSLSTSFQAFNSTPTNKIGGLSDGNSYNSGNNATIILHALPDSYDFPALASTLEKILTGQGLKISSISGTDDQLAEQNNNSSPNPQPVPMPFSFSISDANYSSIQQLINTLQLSIRPIQIDSLTLTGGGNNMTLTVNAHTYYQPGKSLDITQKVIK
jgi:hypothetical protein